MEFPKPDNPMEVVNQKVTNSLADLTRNRKGKSLFWRNTSLLYYLWIPMLLALYSHSLVKGKPQADMCMFHTS